MKYVNFKPYVGQNYTTTGYLGKKIMVLDEYRCCDHELSPEGRCYPQCRKELMIEQCFSRTGNKIEEFIHNRNNDELLCFERAIFGRDATPEERDSFWNGIIYYEYLQFSLSDPKLQISTELWEQSSLGFKELLETYLPDYIIAWGARLYNGLPELNGNHSLVVVDNFSLDVWEYSICRKKISVIRMHRPNSPTGKDWKYWHKFYQKFLGLQPNFVKNV